MTAALCLLLLWLHGSAGETKYDRIISLVGDGTKCNPHEKPIHLSQAEVLVVTVKDVPKKPTSSCFETSLHVKADGIICVGNEEGERRFANPLMPEIQIHYGGAEPFSQKYSRYSGLGEICSIKNEVKFVLKWGGDQTYDIKTSVLLYFVVMRVDNAKRRLFLSRPFCDNKPILNHSMVTVYDVQPPVKHDAKITMTRPCGIKFKVITEQPKICLQFIGCIKKCKNDWKLGVDTGVFELRDTYKFERECKANAAMPDNMYWCTDEGDFSNVFVIIENDFRNDALTAEGFQLIVSDVDIAEEDRRQYCGDAPGVAAVVTPRLMPVPVGRTTSESVSLTTTEVPDNLAPDGRKIGKLFLVVLVSTSFMFTYG